MTSLWLDGRPPIPTDALDLDGYEVVVVGAGLTGLTTGLLLARAGRGVAIVEAREVGAVATGNTTGKLSLLQGTKLSRMLRHQSEHVARAYLDGNRAGQEWLWRFCDENDVPVQRRDAVTYAATRHELRSARQELQAARTLGLAARWQDELPMPAPHVGGAVLPDQGQFDPMDVLAALAERFRAAGGTLVTGTRVTGADFLGAPVLHLQGGRRLLAGTVVLATGTPILDRGLSFAKVEAKRSYCLAFEYPDPPQVMALSSGSATRSLRDAPVAGTSSAVSGDRLVVGGEGHPVGRAGSELDHVDRLREWTQTYFPGAVQTHAWSAQDYTTHDGIPTVGPLPRGGGDIYIATGYDKWGMTNAVMASLDLVGQLQGRKEPWSKPMRRRITRPRGAAALAGANARIGVAAVGSVIGAAVHRDDHTPPAEGRGRTARQGVVPTGTATVQGRTCAVAAVCTHLGGVLEWNDAERSWDCPLHGSRFDADGAVLEGPATRPLRQR